MRLGADEDDGEHGNSGSNCGRIYERLTRHNVLALVFGFVRKVFAWVDVLTLSHDQTIVSFGSRYTDATCELALVGMLTCSRARTMPFICGVNALVILWR